MNCVGGFTGAEHGDELSEALEEIETFPTVSAAILIAGESLACDQIIQSIRRKIPGLPVVVLSPLEGFTIRGVDHIISSHNPERLVALMRELLGPSHAGWMLSGRLQTFSETVSGPGSPLGLAQY